MRCADAVIALLAIAGAANELGMAASTTTLFFASGISSSSKTKTQVVETRVLRTEIDVEGDAAPGAQRSSSSSTSAGSSSWSSIKSQTSVVQQNKSPPARTAERRTATTEQASTKSLGDGSTEALASNSKHSANAAVQQQARAMELSSSKKLLMSQKTKERSTPSQAYAIKGTPGPGGWSPEASEGLGCGGPEGTEALVDKSQKLGVRCCGDSPTVIAAGGTLFPLMYTYPNGNRLDCKTPPAGNCGPGQGISWNEAAAVCSAYESRRLCTVEEMKLLQPFHNKESSRLITPAEIEGEQGPGTWPEFEWGNPLRCLSLVDGQFSGDACCSHTGDVTETYGTEVQGQILSPGYWFAKFKDGNLHYVSKVKLWNRGGTYASFDRLNNACIRFTTDGTKPSDADPSQSENPCDAYLPAAVEFGTEVVIDRWITGMMFITTKGSGDFHFSLCGIEIYEMPATTTTYSDEVNGGEPLCNDSGGDCDGYCVWTADEPATVSDTAANDTGDGFAEVDEASADEAGTSTIVLVIGGVVLVLAAVGAAFALGIIGGDAALGPTDAAPEAAAY